MGKVGRTPVTMATWPARSPAPLERWFETAERREAADMVGCSEWEEGEKRSGRGEVGKRRRHRKMALVRLE